jgi:hypothetical protein
VRVLADDFRHACDGQEMLNNEIASFQEQRRPDRFYPTIDPPEPAASDRDRGHRTDTLKAMSDPFGRAHNLARSALPVFFCRSVGPGRERAPPAPCEAQCPYEFAPDGKEATAGLRARFPVSGHTESPRRSQQVRAACSANLNALGWGGF